MKFPARPKTDGPSNYLKIKDGESVSGILRGELFTYYETGFGPTAKIVGLGEGGVQKFRSNFIVNEGGKYVAKVWTFGGRVYDTLAALEKNGWDLDNTLLTISRTGSTKENTKYTVTPSPQKPTPQALQAINALELSQLAPKEFQNEITPPPKFDDTDEIPF